MTDAQGSSDTAEDLQFRVTGNGTTGGGIPAGEDDAALRAQSERQRLAAEEAGLLTAAASFVAGITPESADPETFLQDTVPAQENGPEALVAEEVPLPQDETVPQEETTDLPDADVPVSEMPLADDLLAEPLLFAGLESTEGMPEPVETLRPETADDTLLAEETDPVTAATPPAFSGEEAGDGKGLVRHLLQCRQMQQSDLVIRLTAEAENRDQEQRGVVSLPYPVDTDYFSPLTPNGASGPQAGTRILCAARDAADVWQMLRLAEVLLAQCPGCRLVLLCESAAGRESLAELGLSLPTGIEVPERLSLQAYRDLLRTAAVITAPAAACLSAPVLLEAMSCGVVPVLAGDAPHWPLLQEGGGGLWCGAADLVPTLAGILAQPHQLAELSLAARRTVERHFRRQDVIPGQLALLHQARAAWLRKKQGGTTA